MQGFRDLGNALVVALISVGLIIGALSISLVEFVPEAAPTATDNMFASPKPLTATSTLPPSLVPTLGLESPLPNITSTSTNTPTPPSSCLPPAGWTQITIRISETLDSIAARYRTTKEQLRAANCLFTDNLITGSILYVPPVTTNAPAVCIPGRAGWVNNYIVQSGDSIFRIGYNHYTTSAAMMTANCRTSEIIHPGEILWVPNVATRTPIPTIMPEVTVIIPYPNP
jgi:LysM repeat protein